MYEQTLKTGRFKAIALEKRITENKKGNPQAEIQLEVDFEDEKKIMIYFGQLVGGATDHTLKALLTCGLNSNNILDPIVHGSEVSVVVDVEVSQDGKQRQKISWINKQIAMGAPIDPIKAQASLAKYEGILARLRQQDQNSSSNPPNLANTDIPF